MMEWLERDYGEFTGWQWAGILAAAVGLSVAWRRWQSTRDGDGSELARSAAGLQPFGAMELAPNGAADVPATQPGPADNREWLRDATRALSESTEWQPVQIDTALRRYLAGNELGDPYYAIINDALRLVGVPPDPVPAIVRPAPPLPNSGPTGPTPQPNTNDPGPTPQLPAGVDAVIRHAGRKWYVYKRRGTSAGGGRIQEAPSGVDDRLVTSASIGRPYRYSNSVYQVYVDVLGRKRWIYKTDSGNRSPESLRLLTGYNNVTDVPDVRNK